MGRITTITTAAIVVATSADAVMGSTLQENNKQLRQRALSSWGSSSSSSDDWWGSSSSSSGKSGKSGSGSGSGKSGKSGSSSSSDDDWSDGGWGHDDDDWGSSSGKSGKSGSGSGKSGKSGGSSSSDDDDWSNGGWSNDDDWGSSSSGKSGKSGSGSGKSGKSGGSSSSDDDWYPPCIEGSWKYYEWVSWGSSSSSSGKSGKSGRRQLGKSGKSGSSSSSSGDSWHGGWGSPGWWGSSSSSSGKSGKSGSGKSGKSGSKGSKSSSSSSSGDWGPKPCHPPPGWSSSSSSKSGKGSKTKSGKGGKGSKGSSSRSGKWFFEEWSSSSSSSLDSSAPGICGSSFKNGGLECDNDDGWEYCSDPGSKAECGSGETCYEKELCPKFAGHKTPIGVCDAQGKGLDCDQVTTYCTEPGDHGECGSGRKCHDAGLCGYGDGDYDGVCGYAIHGGKESALDCDKVSTKCTDTGGYGECAYGGKCFDAGLCTGGKGFCSDKDSYDCNDKKTYCVPGEKGCKHGEKCWDIDVCSVKEEPLKVSLNEICFDKGEIVDCSKWGDDGYGDSIAVPFTYSVSTDGTAPKAVLPKVENAILDDVADTVEGSDDYAHFSGKISAKPEDKIGDGTCGGKGAMRCSIVDGEMTIYPGEGWDGDGHSAASAFLDKCAAVGIIKESMEGNDYSEVSGVTNAEYRGSSADCGKIISGANMVVEDKDELSAGAAFGIFFAALALLALLFLIARKLRRKPAQEDMSLISNNLDGSLGGYDDPYANTIDVHKCSSIYCTICNGKDNETSFLPAPKKANMAKAMANNGISPTAVNDTEGAFFNQGESSKETLEFNESKGSIMRVPIRNQLEDEDRSLSIVNEVAHDSEIDTELESVQGDAHNDETTVPPPPPLSFHPAYRQGSGVAAIQSNDEISI